MGDVSLCLYPLNYEVREKHGTDTGSGFRVLSDPCTRLITDDRPTDMHEVPIYVGHAEGAYFATTQTAISRQHDRYFQLSIAEDLEQALYFQLSRNVDAL